MIGQRRHAARREEEQLATAAVVAASSNHHNREEAEGLGSSTSTTRVWSTQLPLPPRNSPLWESHRWCGRTRRPRCDTGGGLLSRTDCGSRRRVGRH